jgi:hypothetical protein
MTTGSIAIHGHCSSVFALLRDTFVRNFAEDRESGASIALIVGGETVTDLWIGWADPARTRPWTQGTTVKLSGYNINVNAIAPGAFYLEMMDAMIKRTGEFVDRSRANPWAARCNWTGPISIWHPHQVTS